MTHTPQLLAAIRYHTGELVDPVLEEVTQALLELGYRVAGCLQRPAASSEACCTDIRLASISTRREYNVSQPLGSGSTGCRLDPSMLAEACADMLAALDGDVDLLVLNRFGRGEAEGHGFRSAIEKAYERQIPVLTAAGDAWGSHWDAFGEGSAAALPADAGAVLVWCLAALPGEVSTRDFTQAARLGAGHG